MENEQKGRIEWLDVCKGILIILVVYGHFSQKTYYNEAMVKWIRRMIYSFHMPAFFMISGVLFELKETHKKKNRYAFSIFIRKRIKSLFLPGSVAILSCMIYQLILSNSIEIVENFFTVKNIIKQILWISSAEINYWFIGALFSLEVMMWLLYSLHPNSMAYFSIILLCCGLIWKQVFDIELPFSIMQACISAPFFGVGVVMSDRLIDNDRGEKKYIFAGIISLVALTLCCVFNPFEYNIGVWNGSIGPMQWYLLGGFSGIAVVVNAAKLLEKNMVGKILAFAGRNSLWSYLYANIIIGWLIRNIKWLQNGESVYFDIAIFLLSVAIVCTISVVKNVLLTIVHFIKIQEQKKLIM